MKKIFFGLASFVFLAAPMSQVYAWGGGYGSYGNTYYGNSYGSSSYYAPSYYPSYNYNYTPSYYPSYGGYGSNNYGYNPTGGVVAQGLRDFGSQLNRPNYYNSYTPSYYGNSYGGGYYGGCSYRCY